MELPRKPERPYVSSLKSHSGRSTMDARRRPLRTYSKRTSSTETHEPPLKRRRINDDDSTPILQTPVVPATTTSLEPVNALQTQPPTSIESLPPPAKRGTIMAYFKKIAPESDSTIPSSELSSELEQPTTTPPSSPPIIITTGRKRIRRLRTRISKQHKHDDESNHDKGTDEESDDELVPLTLSKTPNGSHNTALSSSSPNARNATNIAPEAAKRSKILRERKQASVQTTLSLSLTDKGYAECKECDMLYNPLHESDAKHHARRHAALLKLKAKGGVRVEGDVD
ncbi:hypothetical protein GGR57DRAFT_475066 [Xylariaceae sp. FL1272]|nr:hypothetical protein GGR57DRAFT_475066 [Xylariaceae sp. FL1272]